MTRSSFRSVGRLAGVAPYARSLWRMMIGLLFLCHGAQKMLGVWGGHKMPLISLFGLAGILEFVGGPLIALGLFTRLIAFLLCGEMAFAYFTVHVKHGWLPLINGGELAVLYCFSFLYLVFAGAGPLSLDSLLRKRD